MSRELPVNVATPTAQGLVPAPGSVQGRVLTDSLTWQQPAASTGGASLTLTDGTHSVAAVAQITASGLVVGGTSPNATLTASGPSTGVPSTIPDIVLWWESDNILAASGAPIGRLQERTPWLGGYAATSAQAAAGLATIDSVLQNGLPGLKFPTTGAPQYIMPFPLELTTAGTTFLAVVKPANTTGVQAIIGGSSGGIAMYLNSTTGVAKIGLIKTGTAVIGSATTAWTAGTAFQFSATYVPATGAYAFTMGGVAAGSGTGTTLATGGGAQFGADSSSGTNFLNGATLYAVIVANRVLTSTELSNIHSFWLTKWGA